MKLGADFPDHTAWVNTTRDLPRAVTNAVIDETAEIVARAWATRLLPVDTGRLRAAVAAQATGGGVAYVWARTPYASHVAALVQLAAQTLILVNAPGTKAQVRRVAQRAIDKLERRK